MPSWDHPRMRGEHALAADVCRRHGGSSPHARGAPEKGAPEPPRAGIIPACAGSTSNVRFPTYAPRDHPRMRGEHYTREPSKLGRRGSSPHARGARLSAKHRLDSHGIIPACAGSTAQKQSVDILSGDHPRMRGEHRVSAATSAGVKGSSPHARGAHGRGPRLPVRHGIIPACAGSTGEGDEVWVLPGDHPRMRGEHLNGWFMYVYLAGSSPHARGARLGARLVRVCGGIIPACAGSTSRR